MSSVAKLFCLREIIASAILQSYSILKRGATLIVVQTRTEGERIANLEGQITHLATKADIGALGAKIEALRAALKSDIESLRAELNTIKWIISIAIPAAIAITGIVVGIVVQVLNNLPG